MSINTIPYAQITDEGDVKCPECSCNIMTPKGFNRATQRRETMILFSGVSGQCPYCWQPYQVTEQDAQKHNDFWVKKEMEAEAHAGE